MPADLLPVRRKADFAGHYLEALIDDTDPSLQSFGARLHAPTRWFESGVPPDFQKKWPPAGPKSVITAALPAVEEPDAEPGGLTNVFTEQAEPPAADTLRDDFTARAAPPMPEPSKPVPAGTSFWEKLKFW